MEEQAITTLALTLLPLISGLFVAIKKWFDVSGKIKQIRILLDGVDDALEDDKITESEFRRIYRNYKAVVNS